MRWRAGRWHIRRVRNGLWFAGRVTGSLGLTTSYFPFGYFGSWQKAINWAVNRERTQWTD